MNTAKRVDDKFLRQVIYVLLTSFITSVGTLVWVLAEMRTDIDNNSEAVKEIKKLQTTMTHIQIGVGQLVENSKIRNKIMMEEKKRNDFVFGEQKRRKPLIDWVERQIGK